MNETTKGFMLEKELVHGEIEVISCGSSLKLCMVAEGKAHIYPRFSPPMVWDTAAGDAICRGAGFRVLAYPELIPLVYNKESLLNPSFLVH
jgi:3'(2'), 5'-bisphosphate nucleotidase